MNCQLNIPLPVLYIMYVLKKNDFDGYLVGGAVRDLLIASHSNVEQTFDFDFDFTTNAKPEDIQKLFPESFYENDFGTVAISYEHLIEQMSAEFPKLEYQEKIKKSNKKSQEKQRIIDISHATKVHESLEIDEKRDSSTQHNDFPNFEITTYRSKELYSNFRKPDSLEWGETIEEDLQRRDFTINALAMTLEIDKLAQFFQKSTKVKSIVSLPAHITDNYSGLDDLQNHIIKTVGDPDTRFKEDALRMLRAIRFSVQLNMQIEDATFESITRNAHLITKISWERISAELIKILKSEYPAEGIELLDETHLLDHIMPEIQKGKGVKQGGHHTTDVWTHSIDALRECPSTDPIVRLATLLHDVAKPNTYREIRGQITFYNHEIVGSRIAKKIAQRLKLSRVDIDRVFTLVRYHMFYYQPHNTDAAIRRFMRKVGLENIDDILDVREGDRLGSGARKTSWRLEEMKQRMIDQLHQPMEVKDLAINGHDLMTEFNLKPGPILGKILNQLFEMVMEEPELNTKETLLEKAKEIIPTLHYHSSPSSK